MAFQYLSGSTDLANMIFSQILKIDYSTISNYATVQDQVLYLLLIPHVILFLFIYAFSIGIVGRITGGHVGFSRLMGVITYIYIIWAGWYGKLVPLLNNWFVIALVAGLIIFLITAVIHPARGIAIEELAGKAGGAVKNNIKKRRELEELYKQRDYLEAQVRDFENRIQQMQANNPNNSALGALTASLATYSDKLRDVQAEINRRERRW